MPALMATCEAWSRYRRLKARFDRRFDTADPMSIAQLDVAERNMRTWLTSWGLTAASEGTLVAAANEVLDQDDPFASPLAWADESKG